jgi:dienelactone hydrolase
MLLSSRTRLVVAALLSMAAAPGCASLSEEGEASGGALSSSAASMTFLDDGRALEAGAQASLGDVITVRIAGVPAAVRVTVRAVRGDHACEVTFVADAEGTVDTGRDAPLAGGSYTGVDADGPFWSMTRIPGASAAPSLAVAFTAKIDGHLVAEQTLDVGLGKDLAARRPDEGALVGLLASKKNAVKSPALVVLPGSEGGVPQAETAFFAAHGFVSLGLAWYGQPGLPAQMENVPVDYVGRAIEWLAKQPEVDPSRIGILGTSRGSELALLSASKFARIHAAVGIVPGGVALAGGSPTTPAWTFHGDPVPYLVVDDADSTFDPMPGGGKAIRQATSYRRPLTDRDAVEHAAIHVEDTQGPVLLLGGSDDGVWPSCDLGKIAFERLQRSHRQHADAFECYEGVGHAIAIPGMPTTDVFLHHPVLDIDVSLGGTPAANAHAQRAGTARILEFLQAALAR